MVGLLWSIQKRQTSDILITSKHEGTGMLVSQFSVIKLLFQHLIAHKDLN